MCAITFNAMANQTCKEVPNQIVWYNNVAETRGKSNEILQIFQQHSNVLSKTEEALADWQEQEAVKMIVTDHCDQQEPEKEITACGQPGHWTRYYLRTVRSQELFV